MSLADFQERFPAQCRRLLSGKRRGRVGQAYLFVGDSDRVLRGFVEAWGQVCACLSPTSSGDACGQCECCRRLAEGTYPERLELVPELKSRQIAVDAVRAFEHRLSLAARRGYLKLGIIAEVECMNEQSQNAFLKTLEEPPPATVLLLATTQPRLLLPTIRSRCGIVPLRQNRGDYAATIEAGLFAALAPLCRGAGAAVGLQASVRLRGLFEQLQQQAEATVGKGFDARWKAAAEENDALSKRLGEQREARVAAQYLRLRRDLEDGIQTWFLQRRLTAAHLAAELLPHPELLRDLPPGTAVRAPKSPTEADEDVQAVEQLLKALRAGLNEALALDAFCTTVTERTRQPAADGHRR